MMSQPAAADPLERVLAQAQVAGSSADSAAIETWLDLRNLLRAKRPEAALFALERWQRRGAEDAGGEIPGDGNIAGGGDISADRGGSADQTRAATNAVAAAPCTPEQVRAALADADLPAHLRALAAIKRWQTPDSARPLLAGALNHPLTAAEAWNLLGVLFAEAGTAASRHSAADAFARALAADPGHYRALTNRAGLALADEESGASGLAAAEADLRVALQLAPDHHAAHQNLAVVLRRQGKRSEAVRAQRRAQWLDYRHAGRRSDDQARRELSGLHLSRLPRAIWLLLGALLFLIALWLFGGR